MNAKHLIVRGRQLEPGEPIVDGRVIDVPDGRRNTIDWKRVGNAVGTGNGPKKADKNEIYCAI